MRLWSMWYSDQHVIMAVILVFRLWKITASVSQANIQRQDTAGVSPWHQDLPLNMVVFRAPVQEKLQLTGKGSGERHQDIEGVGGTVGREVSTVGCGWGARNCSAWRRDILRGTLQQPLSSCEEAAEQTAMDSWCWCTVRGQDITRTRAVVTRCKEKTFSPWGQGAVGQAAQRRAFSICGSFKTHPDKNSEQPGQTSELVLLRARGRTGDCWAAFQLELSYDLLFL